MAGWIIAGGILVLLALCLLLPLSVRADWAEEKLTASVRAGPVTVWRWPVRKKAEKKPAKAKAPAKPAKPPKPPEPEAEPERSLPKGLIRRMLPIALEAAGELKRKIVVKRLWLFYTLAGAEDPAGAAILFGELEGARGVLIPLLESNLDLRDRRIQGGVDFNASQTRLEFHLRMSLRVGQILALGLRFGRKLWKEYNACRKERRADETRQPATAGRERQV